MSTNSDISKPKHGRPKYGPPGSYVVAVGSIAVLLIGIIAALVVPNLRAKDEQDKKPVALRFTAAELTHPLQATLPQRIEFSGPLAAPRSVVVRAKANGTLLALDVAEGHRVQAGQRLGRIDLSDLESRAADRSAAVESAEATLVEAKRQHQANVQLADQHFISGNALQSSQARLDAARAQLKSAQAQLATSRIGLREAVLVAPIDGIVGKRHVVPGEKVSAEQSLFTIVDLTTLELMGSVATHEVSQLNVGQTVDVRIEGQTDEQAQHNAGRIDRIAPVAEAGTRSIAVVVTIDNRDERLRAGQYGQARVTFADPTPRWTLPQSAVSQASGQDQVWTIERGNLVRRIIVTGRSDAASGRVEVLKGLASDATVLAQHFDNLKEGTPAVAVSSDAAGGADAAAASASAPSAGARS